ncbi:hypothetical protein EUTSA_v10003266mg [Eutrema salsugineum]|uniref:DUF599 domain-containing protein n=1 Tax=Eutrema salsugineum TaxID=72664 RepID=V4NF56_EUTSA|nr:uncharacterized protein LOC18020590 [Eutrema salsugineum]ESQ44731.1 hypothetical protein EUTSA_v10003266mg [Eutrema salsugineum]
MRMNVDTDSVLVPLSLFIAVGYHVFLWNSFKHNPSRTSLGIDSSKRKSWFRDIKEGDDKTGMLAVQSLRNKKMVTILTASISILILLSLAAVTNNAFKATHLFTNGNDIVFGSRNPKIFVLKYATASLLLAVSFFFSSLSVSYLMDANFLINAIAKKHVGDCDCGYELATGTVSFREYTRLVLERGFFMAMVGNRVMCVSVPLLLWMFGPLPVFASSVGLVWVLYQFDFPSMAKISVFK